MTWIEIISAVLGLSCVFLTGRNSKYNFWVGYVYNIFLFILFWRQHLYSAMLIQPVAFVINGFGHWRWTHPREGEKSSADRRKLKVRRLRGTELLWLLLVVAVAAVVWAALLDGLPKWRPSVFAPDPSPVLDSSLLMLTLLAQYLSAQKYLECWQVWWLVNAANIVLYISAGLVAMPIVSGVYLANGIWAYYNWKKLYSNEQ